MRVDLPLDGPAAAAAVVTKSASLASAQPGDLVIICAYGVCDEAEAAAYKPTLVYVDRHNLLTHTNDSIPAQAA